MRGFFVQKFCAKLFCACSKGLTFLLAQEYWRKCAYKMLVKLTPAESERKATIRKPFCISFVAEVPDEG
jgi:hypothetical protein